MKKRIGEPWIPGPVYGALLPQFTVNLVVRDIEASIAFYSRVLEAHAHYADPDFAALRVMGQEMMLHADHAYEHSPWAGPLQAHGARGVGAEMRLLGVDPDLVAELAREIGAIFQEVTVRGHGWREVMIRDPDGYVWAVGVASPSA